MIRRRICCGCRCASGFVALGMCIGLLIGVAQVVFKEAWVKIEVGRRAGREMILSKPDTTIGRAEACDIGLFGDNGVERAHAHIVRQQNRWLLLDSGTPGGTFINGQRIGGPTPLQANDLIQVGEYVLALRRGRNAEAGSAGNPQPRALRDLASGVASAPRGRMLSTSTFLSRVVRRHPARKTRSDGPTTVLLAFPFTAR